MDIKMFNSRPSAGAGRRPARVTLSAPAADGDAGSAGAVNGGLVVGPGADVVEERRDAGERIQDVVGGEAAAAGQPGINVLEVLGVPLLVGVGEHEVPGTGQLADQIVRVAEASIDEGVDPRLPEVLEGLPVPALVDLDRRQLSSGLAHRPGDPGA